MHLMFNAFVSCRAHGYLSVEVDTRMASRDQVHGQTPATSRVLTPPPYMSARSTHQVAPRGCANRALFHSRPYRRGMRQLVAELPTSRSHSVTRQEVADRGALATLWQLGIFADQRTSGMDEVLAVVDEREISKGRQTADNTGAVA